MIDHINALVITSEPAFVADLCYNSANSECRSRRANVHRLTRTMEVQVLTVDSISPVDVERFWSKVDRSGGPDACWPWTGGLDVRGYGTIWLDGQHVLAHRLALALGKGTIQPVGGLRGACACHVCDNRPCCNPEHLWAGTRAENNADRDTKGRQVAPTGEGHGARKRPERVARGESHGMAELTEPEVRDILGSLAAGERPRDIALRYGRHKTTISDIKRRKTWKHVQ